MFILNITAIRNTQQLRQPANETLHTLISAARQVTDQVSLAVRDEYKRNLMSLQRGITPANIDISNGNNEP